MDEERKKIAVIGAGVAGLTAAYLLQRSHDVSLFERNQYLGGHTHTVVIPDGPDEGTPVDTGFIVYNDRNYPNFIRLLSDLGIQGQPSDMSFGFYSRPDDFMYNSDVPSGLFAQAKNWIRPSFYGMIADILRFNRRAVNDLRQGRLAGRSLGEYLDLGRYSAAFRQRYLIPMGAAIWSTPMNEMMEFPAESFLRFFDNHGLLALNGRPHWMTVPGGSHSYVKVLRERLNGPVYSGCEIDGVRREENGIKIREKKGGEHYFDAVVLASHADESLAMLEDADTDEKSCLGAWRYTENQAVLHTDDSVMPPLRTVWSSWNYAFDGDGKQSVVLTYYMNRLQNLKTRYPYFVTLNREKPVGAAKIIKKMTYTHPTYTRESVASQPKIQKLNGRRGTYYCGSYCGYGFHEDAVNSALEVARHFGIHL